MGSGLFAQIKQVPTRGLNSFEINPFSGWISDVSKRTNSENQSQEEFYFFPFIFTLDKFYTKTGNLKVLDREEKKLGTVMPVKVGACLIWAKNPGPVANPYIST